MAKPFLVDLLRRSRNLFSERGRLSWRPAREQCVSRRIAEGGTCVLIAYLDAISLCVRRYDPICSEPVFFRSLHDQAQFVSFTVAPVRMRQWPDVP